MKRVKVCIGILVAIVLLGIGWLLLLSHKNNELSGLIDNAIELAEQGSDETGDAIVELCEYWRDFYAVASMFESSKTLDDISNSAAKLAPLYEKDSEEFYSECETIRLAAARILKSNIPWK